MQENKTVLFTREHKTLYAQGDKVIKVFDSNYKKSDVLNEARNEALVQENSDLNVPSLSSVSESEEGWCLIRDKVEGVTLAELMQQHPEKMEEYMELFVDLQLPGPQAACAFHQDAAPQADGPNQQPQGDRCHRTL